MFFFFQAEDGIRDLTVTGVQTCALPILQTLAISGTTRNTARPRNASPRLFFPLPSTSRRPASGISATPRTGNRPLHVPASLPPHKRPSAPLCRSTAPAPDLWQALARTAASVLPAPAHR